MLTKATKVFTLGFMISLAACSAGPDDDLEEKSAQTEDAMKWKPIPQEWRDCEEGGMICRCAGDVIDCRKARKKGR